MKKEKLANYIIGAVSAAVGIMFLLISKNYEKFSVDGGYTTAATWPKILSWIMIGLSALLIIYTVFRKDLPRCDLDVKGPEFRGVLLMILGLVGFYLSFRYLGCIITNAIFLPILLIFFGERRWKFILIYDIGAIVIIYVLFELVLESRLAPPFFA